MEQFPHLRLVQKITGKPRFFGGGREDERSAANKNDRPRHYGNLTRQANQIQDEWRASIAARGPQLANLDPDLIPVYLQISPALLGSFNFELKDLGIEIISEEAGGFIVGASIDGMRSLREKIEGFLLATRGTGKIANLWQILEGDRSAWKPELILSEELFEKWAAIEDGQMYQLEVGIAFDKPLGPEPDPDTLGGQKRLEKYQQAVLERDDRFLERENHFDSFIRTYGTRTSSLVEYEDSFSCEVEITGTGLKDLVINYPFVFEVSEKEVIEDVETEQQNQLNVEIEILPPQEESPEIAVIDSGLMENHRYLEDAVKPRHSKSYLPDDPSTADYVAGGGHGTRVAGAILYPNGVTGLPTPYQLPFFVRNIRVLDEQRSMKTNFPAALMKQIVDEQPDCKIFNLSIASKVPFRKKHMSSWAASIDTAMHEKDVLFIISAGNLSRGQIRSFLQQGDNYPSYLDRPYCQVANPGQSSFALTVGSMNHAQFQDADWDSLGGRDEVSAFSRIGPGIWNKIKPDVVERGGGLVVARNATNNVKENVNTSQELIRSTLGGGRAYDKSTVGTSFAAPKVSHIAGHLKRLYPQENINLIRALIVQGARLPNQFFRNPTLDSIRHLGYGLPSLERVTGNTEQRISFYSTNHISAEEGDVYSLKIPGALRNPGDDYDILIEVTLAYTAKVRRTRQRTKSYLGTWLEWSSSKMDETHEEFKNFTLKEIGAVANEYDREARRRMESFHWKISDRFDRGEVHELSRNNSTVQKDWTIIKSNRLPEEISFSVRAHRGWDKTMEEVPYAFTVSIEVLGVNVPIYEMIRIENEVEVRAEV